MNILNARLQQKHDIPINWKKSTLIPLAGEIIVYDDRYIDENNNEVIVAAAVRYKIGDGVTPVNDLPYADATGVSVSVKKLTNYVDSLAEDVAKVQFTPVDGTIIITPNDVKGHTIGVAIAPDENNALRAVEGGLFVPKPEIPEYTADAGIEIVDNKISVKLADTTYGLIAVDGALTLTLATQENDGAMSKEDKRIIDTLSEIYATSAEVATLKEAVSNIEKSYLWGEI